MTFKKRKKSRDRGTDYLRGERKQRSDAYRPRREVRQQGFLQKKKSRAYRERERPGSEGKKAAGQENPGEREETGLPRKERENGVPAASKRQRPLIIRRGGETKATSSPSKKEKREGKRANLCPWREKRKGGKPMPTPEEQHLPENLPQEREKIQRGRSISTPGGEGKKRRRNHDCGLAQGLTKKGGRLIGRARPMEGKEETTS